MNDQGNLRRSGKPPDRGDAAPSGVAVLGFFAILGVAMVGGYFLLLKLIDISRQEDCMMGGGRRSCAAPIETPAR
jgi:nitrate reductase NapE component